MPESPYTKIVSLVPSLTELLFDLGVEDQIIGRTRFCIHPKNKVNDIEIIGGTKNPKLDKIIELQPDLIVANKEENRKADIEILEKYSKVHLTEISSIQDALLEISSLGELLKLNDKANTLISDIDRLISEKPDQSKLSVCYFIWKEPWMTVGQDTYIHDVLKEYDLINIFQEKNRYPKTTLEAVKQKDPDLILLSSEPYPFKEKHLKEIKKRIPTANVELVNGEWFSWYGSRMTKAFRKLNTWRKELSLKN